MAGELTIREQVRFDPSTAAVVVVDAQNDFCHPDGLLARQGRDVERVQPALQRLVRFLERARRASVPIFFVQNVHDQHSDTFEWRARHVDDDRAQSCQRGSWGGEFCQVAPTDDDEVVVKHRYSAFIGTDLKGRLDAAGRRSLLFAGFTTSVCVESSLRDAVCHDFMATLVEDCCGAYSERAHQRTVDAVSLGFGLVSTSDRIASVWSAADGAPPMTTATEPMPTEGAVTR